MTISKNKDLKQTYAVERKFSELFTGNRIGIDDSGQLILCPCYNSLNFIEIKSGKQLKKLQCSESDDGDNEDNIITFVNKNNLLIVAYESGLLRKWSVEITFDENNEDQSITDIDCVLLRTWKSQHVGPIAKVVLDTSNTLVATGGSDSSIKVWDVVNNYCTHFLKEAHGVVNTLAFSTLITENTYYLLGSGDDYVIHVWNLIESKHIAKLTGHESKITDIAFANDNKIIISVSRDKLVFVWNVDTFEVQRTFAVFESVEVMQLVPQNLLKVLGDKQNTNEVLVTGGESGLIKVWNYQTGNLLYTQDNSLLKVESTVKREDDSEESLLKYEYTLINQLIFNQKNNELIAVSFDKDIIFHDISNLSPKRHLIGHTDEVLDVKLIGDTQSHIAIATNSPKIKVFDVHTMDSYILLGHSDIVLSLSVFAKNPNLMVSSSKDNTIRVWQFDSDCQSAICLFTGTGHTHSVTSLTTSFSDSKQLFFLSGSEDTTLKYWRLPDIESADRTCPTNIVSKFTQSCHDKAINSIDVSPNNQLVATGSQDKTSKLWLLPNLKLRGVLRGHKKGIWHVQFSPVDQVLATCSADTTIKIWSISSFACLKTFQGHTSSVLKLHFLDEGMQFITSASDGNLKIWNLKSNECVSTFDAHEGKVWAFAKSNDEESLVTGGDDSTIIFWKNITSEVREKEAIQAEELIQNEQTLQNLLQKKSWFKALKMSLRMNQPLRSLNAIKELLLENGDLNKVVEKLTQLRQDQLIALLEYAIHWNTNSKHCIVAHCVIRAVLETINPEDLLQTNSFRSKVEKLLPYCDRHIARVRKLKQYSTFADFVYAKMKLPDTQ